MRKYLFILFFIIIIFTPLVINYILPNKNNNHLNLNKNVLLKKTKEGTGIIKGLNFLDDIENYLKGFEKKFSNNFILENQLLKIYFLTKSNPKPNRAVEGKDGWLFVGDDFSKSIKESKNILNFNKEELILLERKIRNWNNWFSSNNIDFYVAVPPNKLSIYSEFLPVIDNTTQNKKSTQFGLICDKLGVNHINMLEGITSNKTEPLFIKADSHWNDLGAYIGYKNLISKMKIEYPFLNIIPMDSLDKISEIVRKQDLARMLLKNVEEEIIKFQVKNPKAKKMKKQLEIPKTYSANPRTYELRFKSNTNYLKVLIFRDSFSNALIKYLNETFGETVFIWQNKLDKEIIMKEKPDIVISICVERSIDAFKFM